MKRINREQALKVFFRAIDHEDPYWDSLLEEFYDEETDSFPSQWEVGAALGFSDEEMEKANGMEPGRLTELDLNQN